MEPGDAAIGTLSASCSLMALAAVGGGGVRARDSGPLSRAAGGVPDRPLWPVCGNRLGGFTTLD